MCHQVYNNIGLERALRVVNAAGAPEVLSDTINVCSNCNFHVISNANEASSVLHIILKF